QYKVIILYNQKMIKIKLRELLWEHNISGRELHNATGISEAKISEIIRGKRVNINMFTAEKICLFLNCKIEDLIEITTK
ncbi:MAG: helix-turn-helix transcriptional regulator, partial [Candidatus Gastranaerophilales bacterium]|nr:helix-turn-helix transcriptional regulator [Candidatus Gastranaerophilales bacterium]